MTHAQVTESAPELVERHAESAVLARAIADAARSRGSALWIEGPAGIGKTALLRQAASEARAAGLGALSATGAELERDYPFGVVRQLFGPATEEMDAQQRAAVLDGTSDAAASIMGAGAARRAAGVDGLPAAVHGLFWLAANLATNEPHAIVVDDAQWADAPSIRWLDYLVRRIGNLPIVLVVGVRSHEPRVRLSPPDGATVIPLEPLTADGSRILMERRLADPVDQAFAAAGHRATGGNPLLIEQLAEAVADRGWAPDAAAADRLDGFGPPETAAFALRRLESVDDDAAAVARAVAVLDASATTDLCAQLADLDARRAAAAADVLVEAGLLAADGAPAFVHPVIGAAIRSSIPPHSRRLMHRQAADLLLARDVPPARVAPHLLETEPNDDAEVVEVLRAAAAEAAERGAVEVAVRALARAHAEPPPQAIAHEVLVELGRCELMAGVDDAFVHLQQALDSAPGTRERAAAALELGPALLMANEVERSIRVMEEAVAGLDDDEAELRLQLELALLSSSHLTLTTHERWNTRMAQMLARKGDVPPPLRRVVLGHVAQQAAFVGRPPAEVRALALEALGDGLLLEEQTSDSPAYYFAVSSLVLSEDFAAARDGLTAARQDAEQRGSPAGFALASSFRALPEVRLGELDAAEADSREALSVIEDHGFTLALPGAVTWLVECLVARGRLDEAQQVLDDAGMDGPLPYETWFLHLLEKRGSLRIAQGRLEEGVADLYECGRRAEAVGVRSIADVHWRSILAPALVRVGRQDEARALADEELQLARDFGGRYSIGCALLGATATHPDGETALAMLAEARDCARTTSGRLLHARTALAEGSMLRRSGRTSEAGASLREALDLGTSCGAHGLAASARDALADMGARPHRAALTGPSSLTPSEMRIARLASAGRSNRDIARSLFVSEKTVETHLTAVYVKLRIASRRDLGQTLGPPTPD